MERGKPQGKYRSKIGQYQKNNSSNHRREDSRKPTFGGEDRGRRGGRGAYATNKTNDNGRPQHSKPYNSENRVGREMGYSNKRFSFRKNADNKRFQDDNSKGRDYGSNFSKPKPKRKIYDNPSPTIKYSKSFVDTSKPIRLNKFIANSNICSRREADEFIKAGVVSVNGQIVTELGVKIIPDKDKVHFHDQLVSMDKKVYILLNKPKNVITTADDPKERMTVLDLVKGACSERIYPVGRLDRNTTGVLLLTNDGDLTSKLTHPKYEKKKIYHVRLDRPFEQQDMEAMQNGLVLEDGEIKADDISYVKDDDKKQVGIEIHSGRNRIVRRMFEHLKYNVVALDRVYFAGLTKKNLTRGRWRHLSENEVNFLKMNSL